MEAEKLSAHGREEGVLKPARRKAFVGLMKRRGGGALAEAIGGPLRMEISSLGKHRVKALSAVEEQQALSAARSSAAQEDREEREVQDKGAFASSAMEGQDCWHRAIQSRTSWPS